MNENSTNSKCPHTVISKYFSSSPVMDESLSEFKEKKKGIAGPKNNSKPIGSKGKVKKAPKRIRGQKDIRTALKSKKNELLTYAKEFEEVCKQTGVDVDSEQLQLAIALSRSVETAENDCINSECSRPLSAKERSGRIRTTLQEYGFTVPEIKIKSNKRLKKILKKNYKLLLATDAEKKHIISDRYTQVLFENVCELRENDCQNSLIHRRFYHLSTNVSYMELRSNEILYVDKLIPKSYSKGNLLRDWADIPGRPQSPEPCEKLKMNFSEIECSQEELDSILSGTLKASKGILQNKANCFQNVPKIIIDDEIQIVEQTSAESEIETKECAVRIKTIENDIDCTLKEYKNDFSNRVRSKSPDIFDDEASDVFDNSNENCKSILLENDSGTDENTKNQQEEPILDITKNSVCPEYDTKEKSSNRNHGKAGQNNDDIMDLTQDNKNHVSNREVTCFSSQISNFTKRNSNDFMEMTECVAVSVDTSTYFNTVQESTSLEVGSCTFQSKNKTRRISNDLMEITDCVDKAQLKQINIDLTQKSDENGEVPTSEHAVIDPVLDITQSSHSDDDLPFVHISGSQNQSLDDTILLNNDEILSHEKPEMSYHEDVELVKQKDNSNIMDLTESPPSEKENVMPASQSFFDEFVHNHSEDTSIERSSHSKSDIKETNNESSDMTQSYSKVGDVNEDEIDLTQSSNSSDKSRNEFNIDTPKVSNLGRKDEVSIDYDELFDDVQECTATNYNSDLSSHRSVTCYTTDDNDAKSVVSQSRDTEVFDLSDKELEYSLNKSRKFSSNSRRVSGMGSDDVQHENLENYDNNSMHKSISDSFLPAVNIIGSLPNVKETKSCENVQKYTLVDNNKINEIFTETNEVTPCRSEANVKELTTVTPKNSEYIIKTDQVTPMLDYASMDTPARNVELDKYGLKPFKRKRAIQLLTYIYNQTHPEVESCQEDLPSPSKKRKHTYQISPIKPIKSPIKLLESPDKCIKSPIKCMKSPNKSKKSPNNCKTSESSQKVQSLEFQEDCNIYEVTNEAPVIRNIACSEDDWVFQRREKAKLHSCRVPLHIALHNYVSCRRRLWEAILRYEPVNIDIIHKGLVADGHRYDPKELLKYMDKKCITVKTADNNGRNNR